jgi:exodeoxyribonuclease V beta subunit
VAEVAALHLQFLPVTLAADDLRRLQARHAAAQIVALLSDVQAGFLAPDGSFRRLNPGDIAVLVRSRREADALRRALRQRGVHSVYLSDQDSVFRTPEAGDLLRWLQAVAQPLDAPRVRAALAGATLDLPWPELQALRDDEQAWEQRLAQLQRLRSTWQRQGVLAMLHQSLHLLDLPARWLAPTGTPASDPVAASQASGGERRLTNWLHLGELLQAAAAHREGEQALIRWLAEAIQGEGATAEDRVLRLESDAELVQVVTVHKSKGLEYPLVFLPFAQSTLPVTRRRRWVVDAVDEQGRHRLDFHLGKEALAAADRERLREDLRLFYVALTRARHAVWLGVGLPARSGGGRRNAGEPDHDLHRGALGHLLSAGQPLPAEQVEALLQRWCAADAGTVLERLDLPPSPRAWQRPPPAQALLALRSYDAPFERDWAVGSFSALVRDLGTWAPASGGSGPFDAMLATAAAPSAAEPEAPAHPTPPSGHRGDALREERLREELLAALPPEEVSGTEAAPLEVLPAPWHGFPRGALAGNVLHDLLEWLAVEGSAGAGPGRFADPREPAVQAALRRRCERGGQGERAAEVIDWLIRLVHTPLPAVGAPLSGLDRLLPEMEFWMPSTDLASAALDDACQAHLLPGRERPALAPRRLRGLLMGFADLVFQHGGRYWVLDYKSNALGASDAAYHRSALEDAMLAHRYELQAGLYLLALHRLLRSRLGAAYDPARQLGGAVYVFLRGIAAPSVGCVHLGASPAMLEALEACLAAASMAVNAGVPA